METERPRFAASLAPRKDSECKSLSTLYLIIFIIDTDSLYREDGSLEPTRVNAHRLGPKANQGAINAGLRALDRSGKPCRRWAKGSFQLKTFTGVSWEIHRWTAPPKPKPIEESTPEEVPASGPVSASGSSKENKENIAQPAKSENSNSAADVEMHSIPSVQASSPAPMAIAAGA